MLRLCILFLAGLCFCWNVVSAQSNTTPVDCYGEGFYVGQEMVLVVAGDLLYRLDDDGWHALSYPDDWPSNAKWPQLQVDSEGFIYLYVYSFDTQITVEEDPNAGRGRIYRSDDGGESWTFKGYDPEILIQNRGSRNIYATPVKDKLLFTFTNYDFDNYYDRPHFYFSTDSGNDWQEATVERIPYSSLYERDILSLSISSSFTEDGLAMATVAEETQGPGPAPYYAPYVLQTVDGGVTWQFEPTGVAGVQTFWHYDSVALSPQFGEDHTVLMGSVSGLIKSIDGGVTWKVLHGGDDRWAFMGLDITFSPDYLTDQMVLINGEYISYDGGETLNLLEVPRRYSYAMGIRRQGPFSQPKSATEPTGENRVYVPLVLLGTYPLEIWTVFQTRVDGIIGCYLFRSRDDGGSWELININGE